MTIHIGYVEQYIPRSHVLASVLKFYRNKLKLFYTAVMGRHNFPRHSADMLCVADTMCRVGSVCSRARLL